MKKTASDDRHRIPVLHHQVDFPAQVRDAETGKARRQDQQSRDNTKTECQTLADTQAVQFFYFFHDSLGELAVSPDLGAQSPITIIVFSKQFLAILGIAVALENQRIASRGGSRADWGEIPRKPRRPRRWRRVVSLSGENDAEQRACVPENTGKKHRHARGRSVKQPTVGNGRGRIAAEVMSPFRSTP